LDARPTLNPFTHIPSERACLHCKREPPAEKGAYMATTRPRVVPPCLRDDTIKRFEIIRRKAGFMEYVLESDMELTDEGDRHELADIAGQIFRIADTVLHAEADVDRPGKMDRN
jgi:hypothetical protein